jgi:hypothetical protein
MNPRVKFVKYISPFKLELTFVNEEVKEFDLSPYLNYPVFEKLKDESYCRKARVAYGTVVWDEETDLDPDTLYLTGTEVRTLTKK